MLMIAGKNEDILNKRLIIREMISEIRLIFNITIKKIDKGDTEQI